MDKLEDRRTAQCAEEAAGSNHARRSLSLRFDKHVIRTLTGTELKLVGGGANCTIITCSRSDRTQ
jgi:hypothetical protein